MRIKVNLNLDFKNLKVNRIIRFLIICDLCLFGGWGLIGPIFAVFILERIEGANLITVGLATGIYWIVKSIIQIPVAVFLDKNEGEKDDFSALILSFILVGFVAMAYLLVQKPLGLFAVAFLQGTAFGIYVPSWSGLFSRHLDKEHYAFDWSLDSTTLGLASGITAILGGGLAALIGFPAVFVLASILAFTSAVILLSVPNLVLPKPVSGENVIRDHTPQNINR
ncbi:MAG: MFS transporter [Patescibacteria group bacterium]|nr:MFS transporter [Patescibacteria group bacterium]